MKKKIFRLTFLAILFLTSLRSFCDIPAEFCEPCFELDCSGFSGACYTAPGSGFFYTVQQDCIAAECTSNIPINQSAWTLVPLGFSVVLFGYFLNKKTLKYL